MKHETLWFRVAVGLVAALGLLILVASLRGRHRPPSDDAALPSVVGPGLQTPAR